MKIQGGMLPNSNKKWIKAITETKIMYDYKLWRVWRMNLRVRSTRDMVLALRGGVQSDRPVLYNSNIPLMGDTVQDSDVSRRSVCRQLSFPSGSARPGLRSVTRLEGLGCGSRYRGSAKQDSTLLRHGLGLRHNLLLQRNKSGSLLRLSSLCVWNAKSPLCYALKLHFDSVIRAGNGPSTKMSVHMTQPPC
jgi:hypothetical protein